MHTNDLVNSRSKIHKFGNMIWAPERRTGDKSETIKEAEVAEAFSSIDSSGSAMGHGQMWPKSGSVRLAMF
ncbi:unnamed protein product [Camellia sinensis]